VHSRWPPTLRKGGSWRSDCEKSSLVRSTDSEVAVPPQNPVDGAIVGVSVLGVKLAYPDASAVLRP